MTEQARHHAGRVLRMKAGDRAVLFDGKGLEAAGPIHFEGKDAWIDVQSVSCPPVESPVAITLVLSALAGYSFARLPFRGNRLILSLILFLLAFPLCAILIPIYMMEFEIGLLNTYLGIILPNLLCILPFSIFIMRGTFIDMSSELEDSAEIDGCNAPQAFLHIMLPLAQNALIIVLVSGFYNVWGEYTIAKTLASKDSIMPISVALTLLKSEDWNYGVLAAAITMSIIPPITIFAIFQDKLVEGMTAGSIKG